VIVNKDRSIAIGISLVLHLVGFGLMFFLYFGGSMPKQSKSVIVMEIEAPPELGGEAGKMGNQGVEAETNEEKVENTSKDAKKEDKVKTPDAKNTDKDGVKTKKKDDSGKKGNEDKKGTTTNPGTGGGTTYGTGYSIGWGGKGKRAILSWNVPKYPAGVNIEGNVVLSFTILPNGTVGSVVPVKKLDPKLDNLCINALKTWRFEKLPGGESFVQQVTITFPFRLR